MSYNPDWLKAGGPITGTTLVSSALTNGRVALVSSGGLLADSALMTFSAGVLTLGGNTTSGGVVCNGASGVDKAMTVVQRAGVTAWNVAVRGATDDYRIRAYDDAGSPIDYPLTIARAAGGAITLARPTSVTGVVTITGSVPGTPPAGQTLIGGGQVRTSTGFRVGGAGANPYVELNDGTGSSYLELASGMTKITPYSTSQCAVAGGQAPTTPASTEVRIGAGRAWIGATTASTTTATGALIVAGGVGIAGAINAGSTVTATGFRVGANQVVGAQGAAVADATGGAVVDTEARTAINALLARLRTHGLIA